MCEQAARFGPFINISTQERGGGAKARRLSFAKSTDLFSSKRGHSPNYMIEISSFAAASIFSVIYKVNFFKRCRKIIMIGSTSVYRNNKIPRKTSV